jgi:hypothetical protein
VVLRRLRGLSWGMLGAFEVFVGASVMAFEGWQGEEGFVLIGLKVLLIFPLV